MMESIRQAFKRFYRGVAQQLDRLTGGKLTPNMVTWFGLAIHIPIAWLIAVDHYVWAAVALVFFGLFDTLDGQLAQVQKRESGRGMVLDTITDRVKEILLYIGVAFTLVQANGSPWLAAWTVAACGFSLLPGYLNALGEATIAKYGGHAGKERAINKTFRDGLFPFEVRIAVLALGLLSDHLAPAVIILAIGAAYTAIGRFGLVAARLKDA